MPLHIESIPHSLTKGALLRWMLDTEAIRKQKVGEIVIRGREAVVEVPDSDGKRLARTLDGQRLNGKSVQVWYSGGDGDTDPSGHFRRLERWLGMEERAVLEQVQEWEQGGGEDATGIPKLVLRSEDTGLGGCFILVMGRKNPSEPLPASRLGVGTPVRIKELESKGSVRGVVTRLDRTEIEIASNRSLDFEVENPAYRIDIADDETAMKRCRGALSRARYAQGNRLAELREVMLGNVTPNFDSDVDWQPLNESLNESQRTAIGSALAAKDVAIVHGPPGTGKTTTLVELMRQSIRQGTKVLASAPSNLGVDNLFERLLDAGEKAVRVGHVARVLPHLRDQTLSALVPKHKDMKRVKKLRLEANELFRKSGKSVRGGMKREERQALRDEARQRLADARDVESEIVEEILDNADVVCGTLTGLDPDLLGSRHFGVAVIDEACQCSEPACWIPMMRVDKVVLAGDHCQLPPTVISMEASQEGFNVSMQERLVEAYGEQVSKPLLVQHRMHRDIMKFSSDEFYDGRLEAHRSVATHLLAELLDVTDDELTNTAVRFIDTSGGGYEESREKEGSSLFNRDEAELAVKKVEQLREAGVAASDIAVVTPYSAQVRLLREMLGDGGVEVGSIDGFQGREKEVIIISLVRSNEEKTIGFLSDTRRMNVALTRARRALIVIGDSSTISSDPFYERLLEYFDQVGGYFGIWDE